MVPLNGDILESQLSQLLLWYVVCDAFGEPVVAELPSSDGYESS